jgi:hypothetical protein
MARYYGHKSTKSTKNGATIEKKQLLEDLFIKETKEL